MSSNCRLAVPQAKFAASETSKADAKGVMGAGNLVGTKLGDNDFWSGNFHFKSSLLVVLGAFSCAISQTCT